MEQMSKRDMLKSVFGYKDPTPVAQPKPVQPAPPMEQAPPSRDIVDPAVSAKVQGLVWNKQAPQGPKGVVKGQVEAMKPSKGWGQV